MKAIVREGLCEIDGSLICEIVPGRRKVQIKRVDSASTEWIELVPWEDVWIYTVEARDASVGDVECPAVRGDAYTVRLSDGVLYNLQGACRWAKTIAVRVENGVLRRVYGIAVCQMSTICYLRTARKTTCVSDPGKELAEGRLEARWG